MKGKDMIGKLEFYYFKKQKLHIKCSTKRFYNGFILEINTDKDFIIFRDDVLSDIPILFDEIETIEPFKEDETK